MTATASALEALKQDRPEWTSWLTVVSDVCDQMADPVWKTTVPTPHLSSHPPVPLLANASISLPANLLRRSLMRLVQRASASGSTPMATLARLPDHGPDPATLFAASVSQDREAVTEAAARADADGDALQAIIGLLAVPFLQECRRQWAARVPENWSAPYCPICAARPAFVEVRGIERARHARCGRCGAEWYARLLHCVYCANSNHEQLLTLVPRDGGPPNAIEACAKCRGYLKALTRLQGCLPECVYLDDLASVDLDIAAVAAGYARPHGAGYPLTVAVNAEAPRRGLFVWKT